MSLGLIYKDYLSQVINNNQLERPSGHPLHTYHVNDDLFNAIKSALIDSRINIQQNKKNLYWCGLFCLYSAEWFHREYNGEWSWEPIQESINIKITNNDISHIVKTGLIEYWKRTIHHHKSGNRNSYLGSIFSEGGLPLKLITRDQSKFQKLFQGVIKAMDAAGDEYSNIEAFINLQMNVFPQAFTRDSMLKLIKDMSRSILYLFSTYDLVDASDPVAMLKLKKVDLSKILPLSMDSSSAESFIRNLFDDTKKIKKENKTPIKLKHVLINNEIYVSIELYKTLNFISHKNLHSTRIEIFLKEGEDEIHFLGLGSALEYQNNDKTIKFSPRKKHFKLLRKLPNSELKLTFMQNGIEIGNLPIKKSDIQIGEIPVGFIQRNEKWEFCSQGSFSFNTECLKVLLPLNSRVNCEQENYSESVSNGLKTLCLSGEALINIDSDQYKISSLESTVQNYEIEGKVIPYNTPSGRPIYLGSPELKGLSSGQQVFIGNDLYSGDSDNIELYGDQFIKVKNIEGHTLFRKKLSILPKDFRIISSPGINPKRGSITFESNRLLLIKHLSKKLQVIQSKNNHGNKVVEFEAEGLPPQNILIEVMANPINSGVLINMPYPSQGILAYNDSGKELYPELMIEDLRGARILLYPESDVYKMEINPDSSVKIKGSYNEYEVSDNPIEINLFALRHQVEEMFSITPNQIDAKVTLRIYSAHYDLKINFRRYDKATIKYYLNRVSINTHSNKTDQNQLISPILMNLSDPISAPKILEEVKTQNVGIGEFVLPEPLKDPHMVIPDKTSDIKFRPQLIPGERQSSTSLVRTLQKAVKLYSPDHYPNVIDDVLNKMSSDPSHTGWIYLKDLFEQYNYLPLSTFKVWKDLSKNTNALALMILAMNEKVLTKLCDKLESELNVFWEFIPIESWRNAYSSYVTYLEKQGLPESFVNSSIEDQLNATPIELVTLEGEFSKQLFDITDIHSGAISQPIINHFKNELLQRKSEDSWPSDMSNLFIKWAANEENMPFSTEDPESPYRNAILLFPMFAAALVVGKCSLKDLVYDSNYDEEVLKFRLKQLMNFDKLWFNHVYQATLQHYINSGIA